MFLAYKVLGLLMPQGKTLYLTGAVSDFSMKPVFLKKKAPG